MSDKDENEEERGKSERSTSGRRRTEDSLGAALEASLQAGLRSLSDGLENIVGENTSSAAPASRKNLRRRPSRGRKRANQNQHEDTGERERKRRVGESGSGACLIDTRFTDDELVVVADMLGASIDDVSVGINSKTDELVIVKTGTVVGRVDLPWASSDVKHASFKNGILEVHLKSGVPGSFEESPS